MEKKPSFYTDLLKKADLEHPDKYKLIYFLEKLCLLMPRTVVEYLVHFSFPLSCSYIGQLYIKGQLTRLYAFIFKLLLNKKFQQKQPLNWWRLMRLAIILTQQQQIQTGVKNIHLENKLIDLSLANKINRIGYDVAYVFLSYSLWAFEQGNLPEAILFIQESIASDNTWGYPEYLLGWYGLFSNNVDSVLHFSKAVAIDWNFLQRIKHDRICQKFPDIVHQVQQKVIVAKT